MRFLIITLLLAGSLCIGVTDAFAGEKPQWIRLTYGGSIVDKDIPEGMSNPYEGHGNASYSDLDVDDGAEWTLTFSKMLTNRLSIEASVGHSSHAVRHNAGWWKYSYPYGGDGEDIELDGGSLGLTPITAGVNLHPFRVRRIDVFVGASAGLVITSNINVPVDKEVVGGSVSDAFALGWNVGASLGLGRVRLIVEIRSLKLSGAKVETTDTYAWFSELEFTNLKSASIALAYEL